MRGCRVQRRVCGDWGQRERGYANIRQRVRCRGEQASDDEYDDDNATLVSIRLVSWLDGCDSYFTIFRYVSVSLKRCSCWRERE